MIQIINKNPYGYINFSCLEKDIPNLPTGDNIATGSDCIVVDNFDKSLVYDRENKRWIPIN